MDEYFPDRSMCYLTFWQRTGWMSAMECIQSTPSDTPVQ
jgi:hypothetical protein